MPTPSSSPSATPARPKIVQMCSAEQLLVLTDRGPYYVPEGPTSPFRASSIAFYPFGSPWPITTTAQVQPFDNGAIMVSGSLIIKARQTGNVTATWDADEVSLLSHAPDDSPDRIAVISNFAGDPERYAVMRNDDGTLAVLQLVEAQKIRNFTPWTTNGEYLSVASISAISTPRSSAPSTATPRTFSNCSIRTITLDAAKQYASKAAMDAAVAAQYGDTTINVVTPDYHLGEWPITIRTVPAGPFTVGLYYTSVTQTLPPVIDGPEGPMAGDFMRILECYVHVLSSARFSAEGYTLSAYQLSDDISLPPPLKNGPQRFQFLGWDARADDHHHAGRPASARNPRNPLKPWWHTDVMALNPLQWWPDRRHRRVGGQPDHGRRRKVGGGPVRAQQYAQQAQAASDRLAAGRNRAPPRPDVEPRNHSGDPCRPRRRLVQPDRDGDLRQHDRQVGGRHRRRRRRTTRRRLISPRARRSCRSARRRPRCWPGRWARCRRSQGAGFRYFTP
jgi:hypothetical protein